MQVELDLRKALDNRQHFISVFFDLKKAYDTAWRRGILQQLHMFGLRGHFLIFIQNFLSNRRIQVRVGNVYSEERVMEEGIPQGSVLNCSLFMIAINEICNVIPANVGHSLYVDDFAIYASGSQVHSIQRRLQTAISRLETWSREMGFKFSAVQTKSLHICRKHHCTKIAPLLSLYDSPIESVDTFKYLGVTFDSTDSRKPHITNLRTQAFKALDLFKHLTSKKWGADRKALLRLYMMLLKPKLDYECEINSSAANTYMKSVYSLQNCALQQVHTGALLYPVFMPMLDFCLSSTINRQRS